MARLPTDADLGITSPFSERRIASYDATGYAKGAAALAGGALDLGRGLQAASADVAAVAQAQQKQEDRLRAARAKTEMAVEDMRARNDSAKDPQYADLEPRHYQRLLGYQMEAASHVTDPQVRETLLAQTSEDVLQSTAWAGERAKTLAVNAKLDDWTSRGDAAIKETAHSPDEAARVRVIDRFNEELGAFANDPRIGPQQARALGRQFVEKYSFAQGQARVAIDPAGVLHDLDQVETVAATGAEAPAQGAEASADGKGASGAGGHIYEFIRPEQRAILRDQAERNLHIAQLTTAAERGTLLKEQFQAAGAGAPGVRLPDRAVIEGDPELLANPDRQNDLLRHYDAAALAISKRQAAIDKFMDPSQTFNRRDPADREAVDQLYQWWGGGRNIFQAVVDRTGIVPSVIPNQIRGLLESNDVKKVQEGLELLANLLTNNPHIFKGIKDGEELAKTADWFREQVDAYKKPPDQVAQKYMLEQTTEYQDKRRKEIANENLNARAEREVTLEDLAGAFNPSPNWQIDPEPGFNEKQQQELLFHYRELVKDIYQNSSHKDWHRSKKEAARQLSDIWGISNVNGSRGITGGGVLMMYPPDRVVDDPDGPAFIAKDARAVIKQRKGEDADPKTLRFIPIPGRTAQALKTGEPVPYQLGYDDKNGVPQILPGEPYLVDRGKIAAAITADRKAQYDAAQVVDKQTEDNKLVARGGRGLSPEQREERLAIIAQRKRERDERDGIAPTTKQPQAPPPTPPQERGGSATPSADEKPSGPNLFAPVDWPKGKPGTSGAAEFNRAQPSIASVAGAAIRTHNTVGALLSAEDRGLPQHREKGFNAWDRIVGTQYEKHWHRFVDVRNSEAFEMRRRQIERETEDRRILAAAPAYVRLPAQGIAGFLDLPTALPVGAVLKGAKIASTVHGMAGLGAAAGMAQEGILHTIESTRTYGESAENIAMRAGTTAGFKAGKEWARSKLERAIGDEMLAAQNTAAIRPGQLKSGW